MIVSILLVIYMKILTFFLTLIGCFEPQPQYINTKDDDSDSGDNSGDGTHENQDSNQDDNPNGSTSESDSSGNNSDNSNNTNEEPEHQEPSSEPELPTYSGGYNVNLCSPETQATGYAVGQVAGDFELIDQYGENLRLSDFCGNTVLLVAAAFW